ncbi:hypothetical protein MKX03_028394 [Papaver bracteatum]|nr:hypothetical protein MKX03_028394 [Papaver bracteatum]
MIGFGVPGRPCVRFRSIPAEAIGPPYFYYENVSSALKDDWPTISSFLFDIQPEFVDSMFFSAAARKRGYVHNLPVTDRFQLQPIPPQTIVEALPMTRPWWPSWDPRTKFNCLVTRKGSSQFTEKIRKALEDSNNEPSPELVTYIKQTCRRWNLVWVAKNTAVPLEANEIEALLGYPKNHTRGGGIGSSERFERLGNSFQVDTIGYHLSVLKKMYPNGMNVLSLFSGIGGAEVALDRLGIRLKNVVSVEVLESCQKILRNWWESTYQTGNLIEIGDVQELDNAKLESLVNDVGGFDLIIGGSPCNNLSGNNRKSRVGLDGDKSCLFFDYVRVLKQVKTIMAGRIQG